MKPAKSFLRKVETLERWVSEGGAPSGYSIPDTPEKLRRWSDPDLNVSSWASRNLHAPRGPYPELRLRFDLAIASLLGHGRRTRTRSQSREMATLKKENRVLAQQVVYLNDDLAELRMLLGLQTDLRVQAEAREAELLKRLAVVAPLRVPSLAE